MAKRKMTKTVKMHFVKLTFRSVLFIMALVVYIYNAVHNTGETFSGFEENRVLLSFIWAVFFVEMLLRFFPSGIESMGCQKQFKKNYVPKDSEKKYKLDSFKSTLAVVLSWIGLNAVLGALHIAGVFSDGIMLLIALFYAVCDTVCILFYCPFQTLMMKNKCCVTCRIYNWDYAMMLTPMIFVPNVYSYSLVLVALVLLVKWEITVKRYPERFSEEANCSLSCRECKERLCQHKSQLRAYLKKGKFNLKGNRAVEE